jgi:hypothetical protein
VGQYTGATESDSCISDTGVVTTPVTAPGGPGVAVTSGCCAAEGEMRYCNGFAS